MNVLKHIKTGRLLFYPFFVLLVSCGPGKQVTQKWDTFTGDIFGTAYHITLRQSGEFTHMTLQRGIDSVLNEVNRVFSTYDTNTFLTAFNRNQLDAYAHSHKDEFAVQLNHFKTVWRISRKVNLNTNGAFDPTAGPIFEAWGFAEKKPRYKGSPQLETLLLRVGMDKVVVAPDTVYKTDSLVELNFNAVAKGYGVDVVSEFLMAKGIRDFMVEVGGEVRTKGVNRDDTCWQLGINNPLKPKANSLFAVIAVCDQALATSGNYRNFYYNSEGKVIGHTINPATGMPVVNSLKSASVIATHCATADAYATAFMVLGKEKSMDVLKQQPDIKGFLIFDGSEGLNFETEGDFSWSK